LGDALRRPKRHPACRRTERENLDGDAKGKGASGSRESEGKGDQIKGKVQNAVGGLTDALRGK